MEKYRFLVVGGGVAAGYAVRELVERGAEKGEVALISAESSLPYERPPLSKDFLAADEMEPGQILINPETFYSDHGVELCLEAPAEEIRPAEGSVRFGSGREVAFEQLLVATGSEPARPGLKGEELEGVHYLRSLQDARRLRSLIEESRSIAIIGGGFIATEVAAQLVRREMDVTLVCRDSHILPKLACAPLSGYFEELFTEKGCTILKQEEVIAFEGDGKLRRVKLKSGRTLESELALVAVGARPRLELLKGTELEVAGGVRVDEYLDTDLPGVYAAGDILRFRDIFSRREHRIEHWDNAVQTGRHAARRMTGLRERYLRVPYFFSDLFHLSFEVWGFPEADDQMVRRGGLQRESVSYWWLREGRVAAALVLGRPEEEQNLAPYWVRQGREVPATRISDESTDLASFEETEESTYDRVLDYDRI